MNLSALSLEQAPPYRALLYLFLPATFFGIAFGAALLIFSTAELTDRYSPVAVGILHLVSVGFMLSVMFGALLQMLPVLAGVNFKNPLLLARFLAVTLGAGSVFLSLGFILYERVLLILAAIFLGGAVLVFSLRALYILQKAKYTNHTILTFKLSLVFLVCALFVALHLLGGHISGNLLAHHYAFVNIHAASVFFCWVLLLLSGVAFQVIPMFYVASEFSRWIKRGLLVVLFLGVAAMIFGVFYEGFFALSRIFFGIYAVIFSLVSIRKLFYRKRKSYEPTVVYWYFGLANIFLFGVLLALSTIFTVPEYIFALIAGIGGVAAIIQGMLYKIIPFLAWFHLSFEGYFDAPNMREIIGFDTITLQMRIFFAAYVALLGTLVSDVGFLVAGILFIVSFGLLFRNLYIGSRVYFSHKENHAVFGDK